MSDPIDVDWQFTRQWPGDATRSGHVPVVGEHVLCHRPSDGKTLCGTVEENRCGLFLTTCLHSRVVLTASLWAVHPLERSATCRQGAQTSPSKGDQVT
ncbi:hypothetical protein ACIQH0_33170 [Streptomyces griseus]|uniref:hypothetical protein n=1 Tax=Streptomyces griseus TaxID=1911 RepID=UPI0038066FD0